MAAEYSALYGRFSSRQSARAKLVARIGELPLASLQRVDEGLRTALALP